LLSIFLDQTRYKDIPIMINNVVQTGANTQDGGFHEGLLMIRYHVFTLEEVKKEPKKPAIRGIEIEINNFPKLSFFIFIGGVRLPLPPLLPLVSHELFRLGDLLESKQCIASTALWSKCL